jgi:DNA-binding CsgD family transcriptional regulator
MKPNGCRLADGRRSSCPGVMAEAGLTPRERQVVGLLADGKSNKEVGQMLGISVHTAETHRANIMRKLKLHSMSALVRYAIRERIVQP